jgi:hypothetical protein
LQLGREFLYVLILFQYYRDAVNHYYEAYHWANRIVPKDDDYVPTPEELAADEGDQYFTQKELDEIRSIICSNCALAHMCLKNWGYVRDEAKKVRKIVCWQSVTAVLRGF